MHPGAVNGWTKTLADGTKILGCDLDVDAGRASWRKSQLDGMISAGVCECIQQGLITADLSGTGPFWQSDDLMAPMRLNATVMGVRTARRVEKQILPTDKFIYVLQEPTTLDIFIEERETKSHEEHSYVRTDITLEQVGQWVVAEIDLIHNQVKWYISKAMI
jgi:hypothetical protein